MTASRAKIFWTGRSQAVRLPKEFRLSGEAVSIRRSGNAVILEPLDEWPADYVESFAGAERIERAPQGDVEERESM